MLEDVTNQFSKEKFAVHFFDENNYELLVEKINSENFYIFSKEIKTATLEDFQQNKILSVWKSIERQFGLRTV